MLNKLYLSFFSCVVVTSLWQQLCVNTGSGFDLNMFWPAWRKDKSDAQEHIFVSWVCFSGLCGTVLPNLLEVVLLLSTPACFSNNLERLLFLKKCTTKRWRRTAMTRRRRKSTREITEKAKTMWKMVWASRSSSLSSCFSLNSSGSTQLVFGPVLSSMVVVQLAIDLRDLLKEVFKEGQPYEGSTGSLLRG